MRMAHQLLIQNSKFKIRIATNSKLKKRLNTTFSVQALFNIVIIQMNSKFENSTSATADNSCSGKRQSRLQNSKLKIQN